MELKRPWLPLVILAAALILWAGIFAAGAYLELGADQPHRDIRKPLIILGSMAVFLAFWGLALWLRAGRNQRRRSREGGNPASGRDRLDSRLRGNDK